VRCVLRMVVEEDQDLVAIPFETPLALELSLAWKKGAYLSRADRAFVEFVREQTRESAPLIGNAT